MSFDMPVDMTFPEYFSATADDDNLYFYSAGAFCGVVVALIDICFRRKKIRWF